MKRLFAYFRDRKIEELGSEFSKCIEFGEKEKATVLYYSRKREKQNIS